MSKWVTGCTWADGDGAGFPSLDKELFVGTKEEAGEFLKKKALAHREDEYEECPEEETKEELERYGKELKLDPDGDMHFDESYKFDVVVLDQECGRWFAEEVVEPALKPLTVLNWISTDSMHDADDIPMLDWENGDGPFAYFGAWDDAFNFVDESIRPDSSNTRHFFIFNRVPTSKKEAEKAVANGLG